LLWGKSALVRARIVICRAISQYNNTEGVKGPSNYLSLLVNRAKMEGIVVFDNAANYGTAAEEMAGWIHEGKLHSKVDVQKGIRNFLPTLMMLFSGNNFVLLSAFLASIIQPMTDSR
jgi:NADPH-dependent curcumin reductase